MDGVSRNDEESGIPEPHTTPRRPPFFFFPPPPLSRTTLRRERRKRKKKNRERKKRRKQGPGKRNPESGENGIRMRHKTESGPGHSPSSRLFRRSIGIGKGRGKEVVFSGGRRTETIPDGVEIAETVRGRGGDEKGGRREFQDHSRIAELTGEMTVRAWQIFPVVCGEEKVSFLFTAFILLRIQSVRAW